MASNDSFTSYFDDSFMMDDLDNDISRLKVGLERLSINFEVDSLIEILEQCLRTCNDELLDAKIFCDTLPTARRVLSEHVGSIAEALTGDDGIQSLAVGKQRLATCHGLLEFWQKCVEHVSKLRGVVINDVKSLPENVLEAVKLIFLHCEESSRIYGDSLEALSGELTKLFRKAATIFQLFLATLEGVIAFDTDTDSETELLVKVLNTIASIAAITRELDLKVFVETNRTFCNLAVAHRSKIERVSLKSVTLHFGQLSKHVASNLSTFKDSDDGIDERTIHGTGILLKVLSKMLDAYYSCLDGEVLFSVLELLLNMHRCSPPCLKLSQVDQRARDLINVHVSRGIEPLMSAVFRNTEFKQAYFEYGCRTDVDKLGYHFLTLTIMKKLISMPYEHHCKWTLGADSILDVALLNINDLQEEICVGDLRLPGVHEAGERQRHVTLYEATLVPICSLISQVPADGFYAVELLLLMHLLSNRFWSSLLSADIWCFLGRLGSSDLCAGHVNYLLKVHAALAKRQCCFELVVLEGLIGRLYALLSDETKHAVVADLKDTDDNSWFPIAGLLPAKTRSFLGRRLASTLNEIPSVFRELYERPTAQTWSRLVLLLSIIGKLNHVEDKRTVGALARMWSTVANTIGELESRYIDIMSDFIAGLLNAVQPGNVEDDAFVTILEALIDSSICFPAHLKASIAHRLRNNAEFYGECPPKIAALLAELNCRLLEDENPWVRQEAVEGFEHFAHTCPNEALVTRMATAITRRPSISDFLPAYLSRNRYYQLRDYQDLRDYLQRLGEDGTRVGRHVCRVYEDSQRAEKIARVERPASERVLGICEELDDIVSRRAVVSEFAIRRLRATCEKVFVANGIGE